MRAFDGSRSGPADPAAVLVLNTPSSLSRLVAAPGELGFARALVTGDIDIEGDLVAALELRHHLNARRGSARFVVDLLWLALTAGAPVRRIPRRPRRPSCAAAGTPARATPWPCPITTT